MNAPQPDWNLYRSFLKVLETGSLSAAARALGLTQPTIARHVEALESNLGFPLFTRSQQGLAPTDAAHDLKPHAEAMAAAAAAMLRTASGQGGTVRGTVRISASEIVGAEILPPILRELREQHAEIEFELVLSNTVDDLLRRDADVAVRMVEPAQGALLVKRLGSVAIGLHAHKAYLERNGRPADIEELRRHTLIGFDRETPAIRSMRSRATGLGNIRFAFRADSDLAQLAALKAGLGIALCQVPLARRYPDLEYLLPGAIDLKLGVWVAMHENLRGTPRCRTVFDGLAAGLRAYLA